MTSSFDPNTLPRIFSQYYDFAKCDAYSQTILGYNDYSMNIFFMTWTEQPDRLTSLYQLCTSLTESTNDPVSWCYSLSSYTDIIPFTSVASNEIYEQILTSSSYIKGQKTLYPYNTEPITITDQTYVFQYYPFTLTFNSTYTTLVEGYGTYFPVTIETSGISSTVLTSSKPVTLSNDETITTANEMVSSAVITADIYELIYCGIEALIYDFIKNETRFASYIQNHKNDSDVSDYLGIIDRYSTVDLVKHSTAFQKVNAVYYNFIFQLPWERQSTLIDYMGYCYLGKQTMAAKGSDTFQMRSYTESAGNFFTQLFELGDMRKLVSYISTATINPQGNNVTIVTTTQNTLIDSERALRPFFFPTSINDGESPTNSWGNALVTTVSLASGLGTNAGPAYFDT
ncbi:unnamed protein product [Ambrosiozyma monospora]|uniref:Unnamed protein product n=1 Tax=Ambrosiozyma monospora TaxID=43982 RepID=A0ACB5T3L7_AMBMO|nr:unnamed protein product [Ambrosiozyma monospora]